MVMADAYFVAQVGALCLQPGLQQRNLTGQGLVLCLQALLAAVEGGHIAGLLISIDSLVKVTVETYSLIDKGQDLLCDAGHLHPGFCGRILDRGETPYVTKPGTSPLQPSFPKQPITSYANKKSHLFGKSENQTLTNTEYGPAQQAKLGT